jgi:hypothetical protein
MHDAAFKEMAVRVSKLKRGIEDFTLGHETPSKTSLPYLVRNRRSGSAQKRRKTSLPESAPPLFGQTGLGRLPVRRNGKPIPALAALHPPSRSNSHARA